MKKILKFQFLHLLLALLFILITAWYVNNDLDVYIGYGYGLSCAQWFWIAIFIPIIHQFYVALIWRLELYKQSFSAYFGWRKAFVLYAIGFTVLFVGRLIAIIFLAMSNANSLAVESNLAYTLAAVLTLPVIYLFYSVKKYFTIERAFGIDHFDKEYDVPYVKGGIFKYTNNGMYVFGLLILLIPGLVFLSKAALIAGLFNYLYIWVHYYCTELPDMKEIYGDTPKG